MPASVPLFVGYVGQNDEHFATLTVKETLQFAYEFAGGSSNGAAELTPQLTPGHVIEALGLNHCQDTILGDATILRGVSGGERKRVTLGEGLLGRQSVFLLDEISTGLDAAATLDIISLLKHKFVLEQGRAVVVSLLQPAPEVFELFDDVLVLNDATRYLVFEGILVLTLLASIAWFFVVAAVSSDRNVAFPVAMASIIAFTLFTGFVVPKDQFPVWLIWGYWIDPLAWSLRALAINSYRSSSLDKCVGYALPGTMTALMGSSGAGKTTLLDVLAGRKSSGSLIRGRSHEQLKRVSIGVELAARNSLLFLDEPTSGLDAQAAAIVMRTARRAADQSRCTIVCTIHQPSASVFNLFDKLLLLQLGGEVVYFGDSEVSSLKTYFERLPGATPLPSSYNPATWILECVGAGVTKLSNHEEEFAQHFQVSNHYAMLTKALEGQQTQQDEMVELNFSAKRAASSWTQMRMLTSRFWALYWRTPSYSLSRLILALGLGVIIGALFSGSDFATYQGVNAGVGGIYLSLSFSGIVAINSVLPLAIQDRAVFYRERSTQSYNALWYFLGATLAEIPYVIVSSLFFTVLSFTIMGFTDGGDSSWSVVTITLYWLMIALFMLQQVYLGQFLAYALPGVELASLAGTLLSNLLVLFSGFNPPSSSIPGGYRWLHAIAPQRYTLAALTALVFADCGDDDRFGCQSLQNTPLELEGLTVKQYIESVFEMKREDIARNTVVSLAYAVGFQLLGLLVLRFISYQRK
ncbi:hypothetical protein BBJ29_002305 [Phytophthora kernoviae]|uniref:AAA+ ATPase domain-containing protein n=1 Tax=Phytophthora kernoviae TaxID=325452 RepID=A0A3F2RQP5_9STRA|nr:hypothetical protein BBJ29_002305 [Phytophthora kernoviae]RLN62320.1 hypothetical protein BBP00_00004840 [Phytophthora kernoviae]